MLISKYFRKLTCCHSFTRNFPVLYVHSEFGTEIVLTFRCLKCGKVRKMKRHLDY